MHPKITLAIILYLHFQVPVIRTSTHLFGGTSQTIAWALLFSGPMTATFSAGAFVPPSQALAATHECHHVLRLSCLMGNAPTVLWGRCPDLQAAGGGMDILGG